MKSLIRNFLIQRGQDPRFEQLESEPRPAITTTPFTFPIGGYYPPPPPPYRPSIYSDDTTTTVSECSSSGYNSGSMALKRRSSWSNLVESDENLNTNNHHCNNIVYPKVTVPSVVSSSSTRRLIPATSTEDGATTFMRAITLNRSAAAPAVGYYTPSVVPSSRNNSIAEQSCVSEFVLMPKGSLYKLNESTPDENGEQRAKRNRMDELRQCCQRPCTKLILTLLAIAIGIGVVLAIILSQTVLQPKNFAFSWLPPFAHRKGQQSPSRVNLDIHSNDEAVFQLHGGLPFKGDFKSVYDFKTRKVAVIDSTLKSNGKNLVCFLMDLDSTTMTSIDALKTAAQNALSKTEQLHGWQETWKFVPGPYFGNASSLFQSAIPECDEARWIKLNYTSIDQKEQRCSECYDFCIPEYGIERDQVRGHNSLNVLRRDCFYLFVPEWRGFAQSLSSEQNQRDFENYYQNLSNRNNNYNNNNNNGQIVLQPQQQQNGNNFMQPNPSNSQQFESKWISLQQVPQQLSNATSNFLGQTLNQAGQLASNVQSAVVGATQSLFGTNNNGMVQGSSQNGGQNGPIPYGTMQQQQQQQQQSPYNAQMNMNGQMSFPQRPQNQQGVGGSSFMSSQQNQPSQSPYQQQNGAFYIQQQQQPQNSFGGMNYNEYPRNNAGAQMVGIQPNGFSPNGQSPNGGMSVHPVAANSNLGMNVNNPQGGGVPMNSNFSPQGTYSNAPPSSNSNFNGQTNQGNLNGNSGVRSKRFAIRSQLMAR